MAETTRPTLFNGASRVYRVTSRIGSGALTEVLDAVVDATGEKVALKILRESFAQDDAARAAFGRESRLAASIEHPNVVRIVEVGDSQYRGPFVAMERLEGPTLESLMNGRALETPVVLRVLVDALAGLEAAHARGIFHEDLCPRAIFLHLAAGEVTVKVVDFGTAKAIGSSADTRTGVLRGKVAYLAPEQVGGESTDARTDVRAIGVILWEALTRTHAWGRGGDVVILTRIATEELPPARTIGPTIDPALDAICARAAARDPAARFPTVGALRDELARVLDAYGPRGSKQALFQLAVDPKNASTAPPPHDPAENPVASRSRWWVYALAATVLAVVAVVVYALVV